MVPLRLRGVLNLPSVCQHWDINDEPQKLRHPETPQLGMAPLTGSGSFQTVVMMIGSLGLPNTPNILIGRGHQEKERPMLENICRMPKVQEEFDDLIEASEESKNVKHPFHNILERKYRPHLAIPSTISWKGNIDPIWSWPSPFPFSSSLLGSMSLLLRPYSFQDTWFRKQCFSVSSFHDGVHT